MARDYEIALWKEITNRTLHPNEKVAVFVAVLENISGRLPHILSEVTRLSVIRKNLLPYLQTPLALQPINSVAELIRCCPVLEDAKLCGAISSPTFG